MQSSLNFNNTNNTAASSNRFANVNILANQSNLNPSSTQTFSGSTINGSANLQPSFMSQNQTQQSAQLPQTGVSIPQIPSQQYISNLNSNSTMTASMNNLNEPSWYNNPKKRVIPQNLVKRSTLRNGLKNNDHNTSINDSNNDSNNELDSNFYHGTGSLKSKNELLNGTTYQNVGSGFNNITFGSKKNLIDFNNGNGLNKKGDNIFNSSSQINNDTLLIDSNDAPPLVSLNDWKREDEFGSIPNSAFINTNIVNNDGIKNSINSSSINNNANLNSIQNHSNNPLSDTKRSSTNVFDKNDSVNTVSNKNNTINKDKQNKVTQNNEFAIIVFGYPESVSNNIITHFSHFGNILENFEVLRRTTGINRFTINTSSSSNNANTKNLDIEFKYPIYTGDGWVKLTYNSQASALRALKENGTIFAGSLLGCVPYSKNIIEQLASCKINKNENIGENTLNITNLSSPTTVTSNINNNALSNGNNLMNQTNDIVSNQFNLSTADNSRSAEQFSNNVFGSVSNEFDNKATTSDNSSTTTTNNIANLPSMLNATKENSNNLPFIQRLNIMDGKSLFVHNSNADNHNFILNLENKMRKREELLSKNENGNNNNNNSNNNNGGMINSLNNWLFGWNNL